MLVQKKDKKKNASILVLLMTGGRCRCNDIAHSILMHAHTNNW